MQPPPLLTSFVAGHHRLPPVIVGHSRHIIRRPPPALVTLSVRPCLPLVHCLCLLPPTLVASFTSAIPFFPLRPLSSAACSRRLPLLSARSRLSSALAGCRITTSCDAAASHPSALSPLVRRRLCLSLHYHSHCAAAPHPPALHIISMHHYRATPASIATGRRYFKCFNFVLCKNGTGARHRGRIAPNRDVRSLPTVCRG